MALLIGESRHEGRCVSPSGKRNPGCFAGAEVVQRSLFRPEGFAWIEAYALAAMTWGASRGLAIAHAAQDFLGALMLSRPVPLRMGGAQAPLRAVGVDEKAILAILEAMQTDDTPHARNMIALISAGRVEAAVIRTGSALAQRLDSIATAPPTQVRPALTVVG